MCLPVTYTAESICAIESKQSEHHRRPFLMRIVVRRKKFNRGEGEQFSRESIAMDLVSFRSSRAALTCQGFCELMSIVIVYRSTARQRWTGLPFGRVHHP